MLLAAFLYNGVLSVPYLFLQLCPEDDCDQGEHHGSKKSQVRVEQHSEDESNHPDHLQKEQQDKRHLPAMSRNFKQVT